VYRGKRPSKDELKVLAETMTQRAIAKKLDVHYNTVSNWLGYYGLPRREMYSGDTPPKETLLEMGKTMNRKEISESLGVSTTTTARWFKQYGLQKPIIRSQAMDLTGERFGKLIAIRPLEERTNSGQIRWLCKCDCGNTTTVTTSTLTSGHTRSCGCLQERIRDLTGQRFGRLTVISLLPERRNRAAVWRCSCDCGNFVDVIGGSLVSEGTRSCGCLARDIASSRKGPLSPSWNPDLTDEDRTARHDYSGYKEWRLMIYKRDNYTCQKCGSVGKKLNAHHIESFSGNPKLRTEMSNGITLCVDCHKDFHHKYSNYDNNREQFEEWMSEKDE